MSTISQANYDAKKYTICAPFCGSRGLLFRQFADRFLTNVATYDIKNPNDPYTLDETYLGTDDSGEPQGQAAPTSAAAQLRRTKRNKAGYALLYQHVPDDKIRQLMVNEAFQDARAAWLLLQRECDEPVTELELEDLKADVRSLPPSQGEATRK